MYECMHVRKNICSILILSYLHLFILKYVHILLLSRSSGYFRVCYCWVSQAAIKECLKRLEVFLNELSNNDTPNNCWLS